LSAAVKKVLRWDGSVGARILIGNGIKPLPQLRIKAVEMVE